MSHHMHMDAKPDSDYSHEVILRVTSFPDLFRWLADGLPNNTCTVVSSSYLPLYTLL